MKQVRMAKVVRSDRRERPHEPSSRRGEGEEKEMRPWALLQVRSQQSAFELTVPSREQLQAQGVELDETLRVGLVVGAHVFFKGHMRF